MASRCCDMYQDLMEIIRLCYDIAAHTLFFNHNGKTRSSLLAWNRVHQVMQHCPAKFWPNLMAPHHSHKKYYFARTLCHKIGSD